MAIFHWVTMSAGGSLFFIRELPEPTMTVPRAEHPSRFGALDGAFVLRARSRAPSLAPAWSRPSALSCSAAGELADGVTRKLALEPGHQLTGGRSSLLLTAKANG